jgi:threonine dehydrogenase-like Zn-dependent dehydrogenase
MMRALAVHDGELHLVDDAPEPVVETGEVLIRPLLTGICNTDMELVQGYYNYAGILGHEFVGEVAAGPAEWQGKRVVGEINIGCGTCDFCLQGVPSHCRARRTLGINQYEGVFADYFKLPIANLLPVPDGITNEQAVFAEPLAAAAEVLEAAVIKPSDRVIVIGAGKLGLLVAQVVRLTGCDLAVVVRHDRQADRLTGWGIPAVRFEDLSAGRADVVIDCTGRQEGFADALHLLRARGTLILKSTYHGLPQADLSQVAVQEYTVIGSRCGPFDAALRLLQAGLVDVQSMIEAVYPLDDGMAAFEAAAEPGALKILVQP